MNDNYTLETKEWLERRFKAVSEDGVYIAHQPIYGFKKGNCEKNIIVRYKRTQHIIKRLRYIEFDSLVDVGCAEGYTLKMVENYFGKEKKYMGTDLSAEACKRAKEIFGFKTVQADIKKLPFKDNRFDVAVCSETLEHVMGYKRAVKELLRISKKAVLISVPFESKRKCDRNRKIKNLHTHINSFRIGDFDFLMKKGYLVKYNKINSIFLEAVSFLEGAQKRNYEDARSRSKIIVWVYNKMVPIMEIINKIFTKNLVKRIIMFDDRFLKKIIPYSNFSVFIVKDKKSIIKKRKKQVFLDQIINFKVPYHKLKF